MTPQHEAEYRLVACLLRDAFDGGEAHYTVDPAHISKHDLRDMAEAIKSGVSYVDMICSHRRDLSVELIGSDYLSPQYIPDLYRNVKDFWIKRELSRVKAESSELTGLDELFKLKEFIQTIESGITERRKVQAAERFAEKLDRVKPLLSTRIPSLDRALGGGLDDSDKMIIGGRPSRGKTALAVYLGKLQSENGIPVGYWSIESPDDQVIRRAVASQFKIDTRDIRAGRYTPETKAAMVEYSDWLQNTKGFHVFNSSGLTHETIAREMLLSEHKICIVDHMQKFRGKGEELRRVIGDASNAFAGVANQKKKIVILLSQLNTRKDDDREPTMGDLKETGDLEQDADIIVFPHIPDADSHMKDAVVQVKLIVAKARESGIGYVDLMWNKATNTFFELDNIHEPQQGFYSESNF
jgi:replicative DNA helicase